MAEIFEVELPDGQVVEVESDKAPNAQELRGIYAAVLPRVTTDASKVSKPSTFLERATNVFTPDELRNPYKPLSKEQESIFKKAKIGDEIDLDGFKVIKASDHEFVDPNPNSAVAAGLRAAGVEVPAAAAGAAAFGATAPVASKLSSFGVPGKVAGFAIPIGAAMLASGTTSAGTRKVIEEVSPELANQLSKDQAEYPTATLAGSIGANAPFFGVGQIERNVVNELRKRAVPAAIGSGIQAGQELMGDSPEGSLERIALAGAGNAVFNDPTKLGGKIIDTAANAFTKKNITSMLGKASTKQNIGEANAAANEIAMDPTPTQQLQQFADVQAPNLSPEQLAIAVSRRKMAMEAEPSLTGKSAEESALAQGLLPTKSARDSAETMIGDGAVKPAATPEELQFQAELAQQAKPTPQPSALQKEIEESLGLSRRNIKEQAKLGSEEHRGIIDEAASRNAQEAEMAAAQKAVDEAIGFDPKTGIRPNETQLGQGMIGDELRSTGEIAPEGGMPETKYQYTIQKPEEIPGFGKIPGYIQIDEIQNGVNTRSTTIEKLAEEGINIPVPPQDMPTGQYQVEDIRKALFDREVSADYQADVNSRAGRQAGFASGAAMGNIASPAIGATIGYQFGDTPEEKRRNALLGALIAGGGSIGLTVAKNNPNLVKAIESAIMKPSEAPLAYPESMEISQQSINIPGRPEIPPLRYVQIKDGGEVKFSGSAEDALKAGFRVPENLSDGTFTGAQLSQAERPAPSTFEAFADPSKRVAQGAESPSPTMPESATPSAGSAPSVALDNPIDSYKWTPFLSNTKVGKALRQFVGEIETNIGKYSQRILGENRQRQDDLNKIKSNFQDRSKPLGQEARNAFTPQEFEEFSRALQNGDIETAQQMAATKPNGPKILEAMEEARIALEDAHAMASEARDGEVGYIEGYFPRKISDYEAFSEFIGKENAGVVSKALSQASKDKGRALSQEEKENVINTLVAGSMRNGGKPGFLKERTIQSIEKNAYKFYEPFDVAMEDYFNRVANDAVKRAYFGKFEPGEAYSGEGGNFGKIIAEEVASGKLNLQAQGEIIDNLNALLGSENSANEIVTKIGNGIRSAQTAVYLGDIMTALAQFGDVFNTFQRAFMVSANPLKAAKATAKGYIKRGTELSDLNIHEGHAELQGLSRNSGIVKNSFDKMMKLSVGLMDQFNKGGAASAAVDVYSDIVQRPNSWGFKNLDRKYSAMFPERWPKILEKLQSEDFRNHKLNDDTRFFLFNEMADMQPLSPSQMAKGYSETNSLGKALYGLKSYMIKQLNIMRKEGFQKLSNPETRAEGLAFLASYAAIVGVAGSTSINATRDFLLDRDADPSDYVAGGLLQLAGLSRYTLYKAKEDPAAAITETLLPFGGFVKDVAKDANTLQKAVFGTTDSRGQPLVEDGEDLFNQLETTQYIPLIGRSLYWQFGRGAKKEEERAEKKARGTEQPNTIQALSELIVPADSKVPRKY